eukprot:4507518-Amphidinium_carterae.2
MGDCEPETLAGTGHEYPRKASVLDLRLGRTATQLQGVIGSFESPLALTMRDRLPDAILNASRDGQVIRRAGRKKQCLYLCTVSRMHNGNIGQGIPMSSNPKISTFIVD